MKLYANLIPAIAYALTTMFSNMAGLTGEVEKSSKKQQIVDRRGKISRCSTNIYQLFS